MLQWFAATSLTVPAAHLASTFHSSHPSHPIHARMLHSAYFITKILDQGHAITNTCICCKAGGLVTVESLVCDREATECTGAQSISTLLDLIQVAVYGSACPQNCLSLEPLPLTACNISKV